MVRMMTFVLLALGATQAQPSDIYKWVDENGVTHYGQRPPQAQDAEKVGVTTSKRASGSREVPDEVRETAESLADAITETTDSASGLDCAQAVENGRYGVDTMLEVGRKNYKDGYIPKAEYDRAVSGLRQIRRRISVSECRSSRGSVRDFYVCLSNPANHVAGCGEKHNYEP